MDYIIFGEILFDCFKDVRTVGGAPLNVAFHLSRLGLKGRVISAVGDDELGHLALSKIKEVGLDNKDIAILKGVETGRADITMQGKNAVYEFNYPSAWDMIPYPEDLPKEASIIYFGSLAQRSKKSRETLKRILKAVNAKYIFFDVNIRKDFYTKEIIEEGLKACTILKLNDEELPLILSLTSSSSISMLMEKYSINNLLLTEGKKGTTLITKEKELHSDITPVEVVDTVGAGDSLSAGFLYALLKYNDENKAVSVGSTLADYVVTKRGATPSYDEKFKNVLKEKGILI